MAYYLRIKIAGKDSQYYDGNNQIQESYMGHIWYEIVDESGVPHSYGFAPKNHGMVWGDGDVFYADSASYIDVDYAGQVEITTAQYNTLKLFGDNKGQGYGFDSTTYNAFTNNCIDFTWKALEVAGLSKDGFEGEIVPISNIAYITSHDVLSSMYYCPAPVSEWTMLLHDIFGISMTRSSPLVMDVNGVSGIQLASVTGTDAVYWDLDQDGFREASGWVSSGEGLLAIDKNNDGIINDNGELFGNGANFANGFAANDNEEVAERPAARLMNLKRWAA